MNLLFLSCEFTALSTLGVWAGLALAHGRFWQSGPVIERSKRPSGKARVAVVIPARDEEESIRQTLHSLLGQDYPGELSILLVNDNSTDKTGEIADAFSSVDNRLTVIQGAPLQSGWSGKLWAVSQGLQHPSAAQADYVLLTDADIDHAQDHLSSLVAKAEEEHLDLVSEMVRLRCETFAERALIPAFIFFFQMLYPFAWVNNPKKKLAGGAGGTMLIARQALDRIDGVNNIRHHLIDDCALAREIKREGKIWLGHSERATSMRVYADASEIWNMIARTAYVQLNHSPLLLLLTFVGMLLVYIAPLGLLLVPGWPALCGAGAYLLMTICFWPTLKRYRRSMFWGLALPLIGLFYLGATISSAFRHYRGKGGGWKNRVYPETV